ncbi:MAG: redoxin family protein [Methylococcaceae bacterium]|nr:redoxin family protein [Methylococcaceae bacterium]
MKQNIIIIVVALIALAGGITVQRLHYSQTTNTASLLKTTLPDLNGQMQSLSKWQGKILIINFWATWCPPCLKEIPDFIQLQEQYRDKNVQFVGIAIEEEQAVAEYYKKVNINYPILIAGNAGTNLARQWGNSIDAVPFTVILNPKGEIIHRQMGELSKIELTKLIQPLLK